MQYNPPPGETLPQKIISISLAYTYILPPRPVASTQIVQSVVQRISVRQEPLLHL